MATEVELLFRSFQRTGDPRAIAEVYDRVAPELLLIAAHFGHLDSDAEDLVQATFLAALEAAESYEAHRRLKPWLIGILVNQAHRERRWRSRRPDPNRLDRPELPDPLELAERTEFAEAFARRLRGLPENYRQVLTLRLVHGLGPIEIAHSLGLPPDTIKTRLRRGREILRQSLPKGFAASAVLLVAGGTSLAAVREVVLARAHELGAAQAASVAAGLGLGSKLGSLKLSVAAGVTLLAAATLASALWTDGSEASDQIAAARPSVRAPASRPSEPSDSGRHELEPVLDSETSRPGSGRLDLSVVFEDGTPAALVQVRVLRRFQQDPLLSEVWLTTDLDGSAQVPELPAGEYSLLIARGGQATCEIQPDQTTHREVRIPGGLNLDGQVVVGDQRPVPGAEVWLSAADALDEGRELVRTDSAGRFRLRSVAPGRSLSILADGFTPRPLELLDGVPGQTLPLRIDLAGLESGFVLKGRLVDADGLPLAGGLVQLGPRLPYLDFASAALGRGARMPPITLVTDQAGRFERRGFLTNSRLLRVWARSSGSAVLSSLVQFESREREIELRLPRSASLTGQALGPDGVPLAGVRVELREDSITDFNLAPRWASVIGWSGPGGQFEIVGARAGTCVAVASQAGLQVSADLIVEPGSHWVARLQPTASLLGRITDPDGVPLANLHVRALLPSKRQEPPAVRTDAYGQFELPDCEAREHTLWITDPESPWNGALASLPGVLPADERRLIRIARNRLSSAAIQGRLVDRDGRPLQARIALGSLNVGRAFEASDSASGRFQFRPIPALEAGYQIYAEVDRERYLAVGPVLVSPGQTTDLGDLVIEPAGSLRIRVRRSNGPVLDGGMGRVSLDNGLMISDCEISQGEGRCAPLAPGSYRFHLVSAELPQSPTRFEIRAGEESLVDLDLGEGFVRGFEFTHPNDGWDLRLDLSWLDGQGRLLCRDRVQWSHANPLCTRQAFAPGSYILRAVSHAGRSAEARFQIMSAEPAPAPILLELR